MNYLVLVGLLSFAAGLATGAYLKDRVPSLPTWRPRLAERVELRTVLIALVGLSVLGNVAVGVLYLRSSGQVHDLATCNSRYNYLDGRARDERADASKPQLQSEIDLWTALRDQITAGTLTQTSLTRAVNKHITSLKDVQKTRIVNPYPPSNYCSSGDPAPPSKSPPSPSPSP